MPYNTRAILVDANGKPIPQLYNPFIDGYEPVQGRNGATRVELYDASGNPITVDSGKLAVRATELEALLDGLESALGTQADAEATGNGSIIAILKRLRTILTDAWSDADNALQVRNVRRYDAIKSAPTVGVKTVTTPAAEIFAGASRLSGRYAMVVYNEGSQPVYWGGSSVTTSNGFPLLPQDSIVFSFDPNVATAIYMVAASNTTVRVVELA